MSLEPFLAQMPIEFRENLDVEDFVSTLIKWLQQAQSEINSNQNSINASEQFNNGFDATSDSGSTTRTVNIDGETIEVLNGQVANVSNSGVALLDDSPPTDYRVEIRNADGSQIVIDGNGRNVNGSATVTVFNQYTVRVVQYFIDTDEFGIL